MLLVGRQEGHPACKNSCCISIIGTILIHGKLGKLADEPPFEIISIHVMVPFTSFLMYQIRNLCEDWKACHFVCEHCNNWQFLSFHVWAVTAMDDVRSHGWKTSPGWHTHWPSEVPKIAPPPLFWHGAQNWWVITGELWFASQGYGWSTLTWMIDPHGGNTLTS